MIQGWDKAILGEDDLPAMKVHSLADLIPLHTQKFVSANPRSAFQIVHAVRVMWAKSRSVSDPDMLGMSHCQILGRRKDLASND